MRPATSSRRVLRWMGAGLVPVLLVFGLGGTMAGCGTAGGGDGWTAPSSGAPASDPSPHATMPHDGTIPTADEQDAAWAARPAFVRDAGPRTVAAYAYALERGDVIRWLPCYCGCVEMDHRSNLDCFYRPRSSGGPVAFEEHGSYCDVCVDTALLARDMLDAGRTMLEIRAAVDATFGDRAPGTDTPLPPAG